MTRSLKSRLALWNLLIIACALALFAALLYAWLARTLYRHHDGDLLEEGQRLTQALSLSAAPLETLAKLDEGDPAGPLLIARDSGGRVLFRSIKLAANEPDVGAHTVLAHAAMQGATGVEFFTVRHERGPVRFICLPLVTPAGSYLQLGRSIGDVDALLDVVIVASIGLVPLVILLTSFGGFAIARRALAPIEHISSTLESIQATDLSRRVDPHARDAEVTRLSSSINHLLDRLQTSFGSMGEFTAEVSHQLQTPLTVMRGAIDMAREGADDDADYRQTLGELREEVDALTATVQDLRDYALADADSGSSRSGPVDISRVFEEAADLVRALAEAREIGCDATIAPGLMVWGNAVRLRQVLLNVGENAVQFTAPGGHISVDAMLARGNVRLSVSDTGAGIPSEALPRVFDRHFRVPGSTAISGTGLGLAIVKRIVDAHGGQVSVQSTVGVGTTVVVTLPLASPHAT
jgi:two-component system OmpR family sensor kinase